MRRTFTDYIGERDQVDDTKDDLEPDDSLGDDELDDDEAIDEDTGEDSPAGGGDDIVGGGEQGPIGPGGI